MYLAARWRYVRWEGPWIACPPQQERCGDARGEVLGKGLDNVNQPLGEAHEGIGNQERSETSGDPGDQPNHYHRLPASHAQSIDDRNYRHRHQDAARELNQREPPAEPAKRRHHVWVIAPDE